MRPLINFSDILKKRFKRNTGLMQSIEAGQAVNAFKEASKNLTELEGSKILWFRQGTIKIQATSAVQRQEISLKKENLIKEMRKQGVEVKKVEIVY